jgi:hypothetical protein
MPDITVRIETAVDDFFKVVWEWNGASHPSYVIRKTDLDAAAVDIRSQLGMLVRNRIEHAKASKRVADAAPGDPAALQAAEEVLKAEADQKEIMQCLVREGRGLHDTLFTRMAGSAADQTYVDRIRAHISGLAGKKSICFMVKPRVYIPWGLVYEGPRPVDPDPVEPTDFPGFWCLKHRVATVYNESVSPFDFDPMDPPATFDYLACVHKQEFDASQQVLADPLYKGKHQDEMDLLVKLGQEWGSPVNTPEELVSGWRDSLGLLYLYCHASSDALGFSVKDTMRIRDFQNNLIKRVASPKCLVFLNGCYTATKDDFLTATARQGFAGYVGAETEVPTVFAFRFGIAFQCLFALGNPVADVMDMLRVRHWPLSLLYGLYALPEVRVKKNEAFLAPPLPTGNYSAGPLGETM